MFAALLQDEPSLFRETYSHLGFGVLDRVQIPVGIEDQAWRKRDEVRPSLDDEKDDEERLELFNDES